MSGIVLHESNFLLFLDLQFLVIFDQGVVLQNSGSALWIGRAMCTLSVGEFIVDTSSHQCYLEET